jgi:RNA polymerase sigma-70 factor (ECF subfamily)
LDGNALVLALKQGEEEAFRKLVEEYQDRVFSTCLNFLHNREDAEDIAQEVFIEVFHSIDRFREEASLSTWLYRIAVSKSLDQLRKQKSKKRFGYIRSLFGVEEEEKNFPASNMANPHHQLENEERRQVLMMAINGLPENQRIAFTLHKIEDLSQQEIGGIMDISLSSVASLVHRAKKNLHKSLFQYYKKIL